MISLTTLTMEYPMELQQSICLFSEENNRNLQCVFTRKKCNRC